MAYIYAITNNINGKVYVGKTEHTIEKRFKEHCQDRKKHTDRPLYRAMNKYGIENFSIRLLEETDEPEEREEFWIKELNSYHFGYNATRGGDGKKYIDYNLVLDTYEKLQNTVEVARELGISFYSVRDIVKQKRELKSAQQICVEKLGKPIRMYNLSGELEAEFKTIKCAAKFLIENNLAKTKYIDCVTRHIRKCANGIRVTAYTKIWKWL